MENKEKVASFEISFHTLAWYKFENEEDVQERSNTLLFFMVQENNRAIKLSIGEERKYSKARSEH